MKKIVSLFLCLIMLCLTICTAESTWTCPTCGKDGNTTNFCPNCGTQRPNAVSESEEGIKPAQIVEITAGDIITFGHYEQDNDPTNGAESIEWFVLEIKNDGSIVLISRYALDAMPYNVVSDNVTWETCTLRTWLNDDFYNAAFSNGEKSLILTTLVSADKNPLYDTNQGNDTKDNVYLLSMSEAYNYLEDRDAMLCVPTEYAVSRGVDVSWSTTCAWWLRTTGRISSFATSIGGHSSDGTYVRRTDYAVRPVICVRLNLTVASVGNKADGSLVPGAWSEWSTNAVNETSLRDVETKTQYRCRTASQKITVDEALSDATLVCTYTEYGSWSDWSDTSMSSSDSLDVEISINDVTTTEAKYSYSTWRYIGQNGNYWYAPYDYSDSGNYLRDGQWLYYTSDTKLEAAGTVKCSDGKTYTYYGHYWFNETISTEETVSVTQTLYRSRPIYTVRIYTVWSTWSEWSDTMPESGDIEIRTVYRYRDYN